MRTIATSINKQLEIVHIFYRRNLIKNSYMHLRKTGNRLLTIENSPILKKCSMRINI